jgi:exopolysaccharide biosynthesis polyprenyl glycosylphosphotransferase
MGISFYGFYLFKFNSFRDIFINPNLPDFKEYSFIFILWAIFIVISFKRKNLYSTDRSMTIPQELTRVVVSVFYAFILIGTIIFFAKYKFFSRNVFFGSFTCLCVFLGGWRVVKRLILRRLILGGFHNTNVLVVGAGRVGRAVLGEISKASRLGFRVKGFLDDNVEGAVDDIPVVGKIKDFLVAIKKYFIEEIIITIPSEKKIVSELIKQIKNMRLGLRIVLESFEEPLPVVRVDHLGMVPLLTYKERMHHPAEFAMKRLFDFISSSICLLILLPFFGVIAILIKLNSKGSVFYIQKRMGYKGKNFKFYKFRSMVKDADKLKSQLLEKNEVRDGVIFKMKKDPRITRVGCFLRKYSLDELPQIFNVLKGDMSLIGPRPFPVEESNKFEHNHMPRLNIRPGITGLAQVKGRSNLSFYHWVKWDLWYINNWSFGLDLRILLWTVPTVLRGKGAY